MGFVVRPSRILFSGYMGPLKSVVFLSDLGLLEEPELSHSAHSFCHRQRRSISFPFHITSIAICVGTTTAAWGGVGGVTKYLATLSTAVGSAPEWEEAE